MGNKEVPDHGCCAVTPSPNDDERLTLLELQPASAGSYASMRLPRFRPIVFKQED
jgi:hypothetical protein